MKFKSIAALPLLAMLVPAAAHAATAEEDAAKFGARSFVRDISMSPEGDKVVIVSPRPSGGEAAVVIDMNTAVSTPILGSEGGEDKIRWCFFVLEDRVICQIAKVEGSNRMVQGSARLYSISADGKKMEQLTAKQASTALYFSGSSGGVVDYNIEGEPSSILMSRWVAPEARSGNLTGSSASGLAVERVDLSNNHRRQVESPRETALDYISDGHGNVRIMMTQPTNSQGNYGRNEYNFLYRPADGGGWKPLSSGRNENLQFVGFYPVAVDGAANVAYGFENDTGKTALYTMALDGSGAKKLVLGRDDVDVDGIITLGRDRRVIGASYATEKRYAEYFDPELKDLAAGLAKALGGGMSISIVGSSDDEQKLLVFAGSDTVPGDYYVYDKATKQLGQLLPMRPELAGVKLAQMKPVRFPAADGTMIPGYLTLPPGSDGKNLPAIVMPHGGPGSRDEWGFDWLSQYFAARGFAVLQPNFRGSAGYGSDWFQQNGFKSWKTAIGDVNDAGRWLIAQGITSPNKLGIVGWSYGGYAALQSAVLDPDLYKAIVAVAPVTDLETLRSESMNDYDFRVLDASIGQGPHVQEGSPANYADRFKAPVLLVHGDTDTNVRVQESRLMESRLKSAGKQVEYIEFKGLAHQLDDADARAQMLAAAERTLRKGMGL